MQVARDLCSIAGHNLKVDGLAGNVHKLNSEHKVDVCLSLMSFPRDLSRLKTYDIATQRTGERME